MRDPDTQGRLLKQSFSATKWSALVKDAGAVEEKLLSDFLSAYWRPCYLFIRRDRGRSNEEAKDLTQDFITHLFENRILDRYREELGRLRSFLKRALKNFLTDRHREKNALRRGGGRKGISFDQLEIDRLEEMARSGETPEDLFDREWAYELMMNAVETVRKKLIETGREEYWAVYQAYDLDPDLDESPTYASIGSKLNLTEDHVTRNLQYVRNKIRDEVIWQLGQQVVSEKDLHQEIREILGQ